MHQTGYIQVDPELAAIRQSIAETKADIIDEIAIYDDIILQQNRHIEADYALKVGCYENELLKAEIAARRERRRYALAVQAVNSGLTIDEQAIDAHLEQELAEWEMRIREAYCRYQELIDWRNSSTCLTETDAKELKRLYHKIVKRLHPDVNPKAGANEAWLLQSAQTAYGNGDLAALRAIAVTVDGLDWVTDDYPLDNDGIDLKSLLEAELAMLNVTLEGIHSKLEEVKRRFPYCFLEKLSDKQWVLQRVQELKEQIAEYNNIARDYHARYAGLKQLG